MSLGHKKMCAVCDELAPNYVVCDSRGMEWLVVGLDKIHFGVENIDPDKATRGVAATLKEVPDALRPWAKRVMKPVSRAVVAEPMP